MKKETAKKLLRIIGIIIYICAAFTILTGVLMIAIKMPDEVINEVKNLIGNADLQGLNPIKVFGVVLAIAGVFSVLEGWSLRRAGKKEKTTLAFVLYIIAVISSLFGLIGAASIVSALSTLVIDAFILYLVWVVRKGE